jgi:hypothetical protein
VAELLAQPEYLSCSPESILSSLQGPLHFGHGKYEQIQDLFIFHSDEANEPSADKASWILNRLLRSGTMPSRATPKSQELNRIFRADLFQEALNLSAEVVA